MCKAMEEMILSNRREIALRMLATEKLSLAEVAEYAGLSLDEVKMLQAEKAI